MLALCVGFFLMPASAADVIRTSPAIVLKDGYAGYPEFEDCDWMKEFPARLAAQSNGLVELTDEDLSTLSGRTLRVRILHMRTAEGGAFSGPKWATLRADLYQDGELVGQYQPHRRTMTLFRGGCSSLSKLANALAEDTAAWLRRGQFKLEYAYTPSTIEIGPEEEVPPIQ